MLMQRYFYTFYDYAGKKKSDQGRVESKRKLGVAVHILEIII